MPLASFCLSCLMASCQFPQWNTLNFGPLNVILAFQNLTNVNASILFSRETGKNWQRYSTISTRHGWNSPHLECHVTVNCATTVRKHKILCIKATFGEPSIFGKPVEKTRRNLYPRLAGTGFVRVQIWLPRPVPRCTLPVTPAGFQTRGIP